MRKIENDIVSAIKAKSNATFGNTEIVVSDDGNIQVELLGSAIVRIENNAKYIFVSLAGWNTATTRGRINAVLQHYGLSGLYMKGGIIYIANVSIPDNGWIQVMSDGKEIKAETV